jgi:transcriptional antiterminator
MISNEYKIMKILNNNVVLALQNDKEKILFSRGIGYKKQTGDTVDSKVPVEKVFSIEDKENYSRFKEIIASTDSGIVGICEEIIFMIDKELQEELDEKIHIALTDHIAFTLIRLKEHNEIENPFLIETETLYKKEFEIAKKAVAMLEKHTGINIPDGEIGFITLHIHTARNKGKLSNTIKYSYLSNSIVELIEDELKIEIDRKSLDYARLIVHIRFALERIINSTPIKNMLLDTVKRKFKRSFKIAAKVGDLLEGALNIKVVPDEIGYLAIYIEKLRNAS